MLKAKILSGATTFHADAANTTYTMAKDAFINASNPGIAAGGLATGRRIEINGDIHAVEAAVSVGTAAQFAPRVELIIGKDGELSSATASIASYSSDLLLLNAGDIDSDVQIHGGVNLVNTGEISGFHAINFYGEPGSHVVRNAGTIIGSVNGTDGEAIQGSGQVEKITNTGIIHGNVELGGGADTFIFKSGVVHGQVRGESGDDLYIVNKTGLDIVEIADAGEDSVRSSVTLSLQANVENLTLTGKRNINAIGTGGENELVGNSGNNLLSGWYGNDVLDGGKGSDTLTGGFGNDEFHFQRGSGKDSVTDFELGMDQIFLGELKGAKDFDDMMDHHVQARGGDVWISYGDDVVVLKGMVKAQLEAADFDFN